MAKKDLEAKKLADINKIKKKWDLFDIFLFYFLQFYLFLLNIVKFNIKNNN